MLNIQNNSNSPYQPKIVTRPDGKIMMCWLESYISSGKIFGRMGGIIYNSDGTANTAVFYSPYWSFSTAYNYNFSGTFITANDSNIYMGMSVWNYTYTFGILCKFDLNGNYILNKNISGSASGAASPTYGLWLDFSRRYLLGFENKYFDTQTDTFYTMSTTSLTGNVPILCLAHKNENDFGLLFKYGEGVYKLNDGITPPTLLSNSVASYSAIIVRFHDNRKYIIYGDANQIKYRMISLDSSTISAEYILGTHSTIYYPLLNSYSIFGGNKIFSIISTQLFIISQNLINGELTIELNNSSENFDSFTCFSKDGNLYLSSNGANVRYVDPTNLNVGTSVNIISSSGFSASGYGSISINYDYVFQDDKMIKARQTIGESSKFGLMIDGQMFHSLIIANNGPSGKNNINYQLTQLLFGYASIGTHYSTNFVYNFNSFIVQEINKNTPAGTSLTMSYSLDGGSSWTPCTVGLEVTATSSTQIQFKTVLTTSDSTKTPAFLDYAVVLKQ